MWGEPFRRAWLCVCLLAALSSLANSQSDSPNPAQQTSVASDASKGSSIPSSQSDFSLNWNDFDRRVWANARTYVDVPIPDVIEAVPELRGLNQDSGGADLNSLLVRVGKSCLELLQHTPNVASHEEQITHQRVASRISQGALVTAIPEATQEKQTFGYLLLNHVGEEGIELQEYRTDKNGRPITYSGSKTGQVTEGFASEWLRLFPGNQNQSRFRFLGRQEVDGRKTVVIAFAEIPDKVRFPTAFSFEGNRLTLLFQGIAWVDAADYRIVRLREDLLAPRPDVHLKEMSISIRFGEANISKADATLWLPQEADIAWEFKGVAVEQRHVYSDFKLYAVHSKIVPQ
ncbi:MAG TPA: hypothetical protein VMP68_17930 [Candidatus Eisenbacteria bacterium]|nr:hypothetical protein [Candidatus Eisenbacteria bacterium]